MSINQLPLFVFGTLRHGHCNHHYLAGRFERVLSAVLKDYSRRHPLMIVPQPGGVVDGELYFLQRDHYELTLASCDKLEEIPPGQLVGPYYQRKVVTVETALGTFQAWAYVAPEAPTSSTSAGW